MPEPFVITPRGDTAAWRTPEPLEAPGALAALSAYLDDEAVTDIFINGRHGLFVDRGAGAEKIESWRAAEKEVRELAVALISEGGRHVDDQAPCVDVRLASGIRIHVVLAPVATSGTAISIRVPRVRAADLDALVALDLFESRMQHWLETQVRERANLLITGGTGTGKTTLLSALLAHVPAQERIVTIEDVGELSPRHPHHVALQARQQNLEGAGGIALARLVRESLRMRPDRLIVGECRGEEVRDLLTALNTGHDGGAGTLHASSLGDVPARMEALGALAGMDAVALARQAVSAFTYVIHLERDATGRRRIAQLGRFTLVRERLAIEEVAL